MLESFDIVSSSGKYKVNIGRDLLRDRLNCGKEDVCLVDDRLSYLISSDNFILIPIIVSENSKSLDALSPVIQKMRQGGAGRSSRIVAVGGGVLQDIATIIASLYMRGIVWEYLPTTLLGMVDSCIGGKSSINIYDYKNLIGNVYPPEQINIDINFLGTLSDGQIVDGLCEAVKICYAKSIGDFYEFFEIASTVGVGIGNIAGVITKCLKLKKWFIEIDEFDHNERLLLNFGHTFGHALESATKFQISHGVAVGIGMVVAKEYAVQQGLLSPAGVGHATSLGGYVEGLIKTLPHIAVHLRNIDYFTIIEKFANDKKHKPDQYRVILPQGDGALRMLGIPRTAEGHANILAAFRATTAHLASIY
jgi:3-dehydroquinate synthase